MASVYNFLKLIVGKQELKSGLLIIHTTTIYKLFFMLMIKIRFHVKNTINLKYETELGHSHTIMI